MISQIHLGRTAAEIQAPAGMDVPVFAEGTKVRWMGFAGVVTLRWMGVACVEFTPPGGETYAHVLWKLHRYSPVVPE